MKIRATAHTVVTPTEVVRDARRPVPNVAPATYMRWYRQRRVTSVCCETVQDKLWVVMDELEHDTLAGPRSNSPVPSLYSFHSSVDGRLLVSWIQYRWIIYSSTGVLQLRTIYGRVLNTQNEVHVRNSSKMI